MKTKYQYRQSIEDLFSLTNQTKKISKCKNIDNFIALASSFGDNNIQGKVFGENFYDFLFLECGSGFNIVQVKPATNEEDIKHGFDARLTQPKDIIPFRANYKFLSDRNGILPFEHLQGLMKSTNETNIPADHICLVLNTNNIPFQARNFKWKFITLDQYEHLCTQTFFKRFAEWIDKGALYFSNKRKKLLKSVKPNKPYRHQEEMRRDNHLRVVTNMAFQGAGKTDDQTNSIATGYDLKPGSNAFGIFPFLGLADQNSFEHLKVLLKINPNLKILNYSSALDWRIQQEGFQVIKINMEKDKEVWLKYMTDPTPTYSIGTYAGFPTYVKNIIRNKVLADFYFDEAASLVPGQQVHTLEGLENESLLIEAFENFVNYQEKTEGRMHYWEACNLTSFDPKAIAFNNEYYFGKYAGKGPYDLQYGIDNNIIARPEVILIEYDANRIKKFLPKHKQDDPNIIDAYCIDAANRYLDNQYGYHKIISYVQSAPDCEPLCEILRNKAPSDFYGSVTAGTSQPDRQSHFKAFGQNGISGGLVNYMCLTLGISENSANGVYMSRNMGDRMLSHAFNRCTRRHPADKPYMPLLEKPVGYIAFGVDVNDSSSLLKSSMFRQQMYKLVGMNLDPKITIIDGASKAKDDSKVKKNKFVQSDNVSTLTGNEKLKKTVSRVLKTVKIDLQSKQNNKFKKVIKSAKDFDSKLAILEKAL